MITNLMREYFDERLNPDELIDTFIQDVTEEVEEQCPDNSEEVLKKLKSRLHETAEEYMERLVSEDREPHEGTLLDYFSQIYTEVV